MKSSLFNQGLIILVSVLWGVISLFSKPLMQMGFSEMQLVLGRSILASIMLGSFMLITDRSLFKIKLKDFWVFAGAGILGFVLCVACYMGSIHENGAGVGAMLMYSAPIWMAIISWFLFKEKINIFKIIALVGVMAGCVMVSLGGELKITLVGAILGIGSGIGMAMIAVFSKLSTNKGYSSLTTQFYAFLVAIVVSLPFARVWEMPAMIATDYYSILYYFLISLISTVLPFVIYGIALKKVSVGTAGILSSIEVVVAALTGWLAYKENIGILGIIGMVIMLSALVLNALKGNATPKMLKEDFEDKTENQTKSAKN